MELITKNKILVGYVLSKNIKRSTKNKPEERQRTIIDTLKLKNNLDVLESDVVHENIFDLMLPILLKVHNREFINFIFNCYDTFIKDSITGQTLDHECIETVDGLKSIGLVPNVFMNNRQINNANLELLKQNLPLWKHVSFYCTDTICPIFEHTTSDVLLSASNTYQLAKQLIETNYSCIYSVTSNPGHHAGRDFYGGYCFINNAMVAATTFIEENENNKVCVLDIDFHAGDGTNDIINRLVSEEKSDRIRSISIHMDPRFDYPHYRGFESENNQNVQNILIGPNCDSKEYLNKFDEAVTLITQFKPNYLVVAFGADTYYKDPEVVSKCNLHLEDYEKIGQIIGSTSSSSNFKIFITQEGGYCVEDIGLILERFLTGIDKGFDDVVQCI